MDQGTEDKGVEETMSVTFEIKGGGSGSGIGYWRKWLLCSRKAYLEEQAKIEDCGEGGPPPERAYIGTLFHAYMELWRQDKIGHVKDVEFEAEYPPTGAVLDEAQRIGQWYIENRKKDDLGKVVETEWFFEDPPSIRISPITGLVDLLTCIEDVDAVNAAHGLNLTVPGYYITDYKTTGKFTEIDTMKWAYDPQPVNYYTAARDRGYNVQGILIDQVGTTKTPKYRILQIPKPTDMQVEGLNKFLEACYTARTLAMEEDYMPCNLNQCFEYNRACRFLGKGCNRV